MLPEIIVVFTAIATLLVDLFLSKDRKQMLYPMVMLFLIAAFVALITMLPEQSTAFGGRFLVSPLTTWFKMLFLIGGAFTVLLAWGCKNFERISSPGEFLTILLFTQFGMMLLISATELITLYLGLELSTLPLFALVAWKKRNLQSGEAGLKYIVYGAMASGIILYGLSLLYGTTGQMSLSMIRETVVNSPNVMFALGLLVAGIGFKLTLAPFHFWAADVYQGAPTVVTTYLSVSSKAAGLAFMFQMFASIFAFQLQDMQWLIAIIATATMTLGNLVAIVQRDIKRFMAFSSISQAGNLILGFLGPFSEGGAGMIFYLFVFIFTNIAVFGVIVLYSDVTGRVQIEDYRGLSRSNPIIALVITLGLFGLAGIPPLAGFVGKFFLFCIAAKAGMYWLVAVAALNATVSLYYYLRVVRAMYIEPPDSEWTPISAPLPIQAALLIASIGTVFFGVFPFFYESIRTASLTWLQ